MSELQKRQQELIEIFEKAKSWEQRYKIIIDYGKQLKPLEDSLKIDQWLVKGCQSRVWLVAEWDKQSQKATFNADSDALIAKGLISLLLKVYSNANPKEILAADPFFIKELGLQNHLSPSRSNGLVAMVKQIKYYATAFLAML